MSSFLSVIEWQSDADPLGSKHVATIEVPELLRPRFLFLYYLISQEHSGT